MQSIKKETIDKINRMTELEEEARKVWLQCYKFYKPMEIKYYKDKYKRLEARYVFIVTDEIADYKGNLTYYAPIGQHGAVCQDYLENNVTEITKEQYKKASEGFYTPEEYL